MDEDPRHRIPKAGIRRAADTSDRMKTTLKNGKIADSPAAPPTEPAALTLEKIHRIAWDVNREFGRHDDFRRRMLMRLVIFLVIAAGILGGTYLIYRDFMRATSAISVPVSISGDGFQPVDMAIRVKGHGLIDLVDRPPESIHNIAKYKGNIQKYGILSLGVRSDRTFGFSLDIPAEGHPEMHMDRNQNKDLTDDGPAIPNQGTGWFAAAVRIPIRRVIENADFSGDYSTWMFTRADYYGKNELRRYSQTQLKGRVRIGDRVFAAFIADSDAHDADYTNDGLCLDVNGDGKIDDGRECAGPGGPIRIGGLKYVFQIRW